MFVVIMNIITIIIMIVIPAAVWGYLFSGDSSASRAFL